MHHYLLRFVDAELCFVGFSLLELYDDSAAITHVDMLYERGLRLGIEVWNGGRLVYHKAMEAELHG